MRWSAEAMCVVNGDGGLSVKGLVAVPQRAGRWFVFVLFVVGPDGIRRHLPNDTISAA